MCAFSRPRALAMGRAAPECSEWVTASKQRDKGCTRHVTARARELGSAGVVLVMALCECLRVRVRVLRKPSLFVLCLVQMIGFAAAVATTTRDSDNDRNMPAAMN